MRDGRGKGRPAVRACKHRESRLPPDHEQRYRGSWPINALRRRPSLVEALQLADVQGVRRSYAVRISGREARQQIYGFQPRLSQPIDPEVKTQGNRATLDVIVRTAIRSSRRAKHHTGWSTFQPGSSCYGSPPGGGFWPARTGTSSSPALPSPGRGLTLRPSWAPRAQACRAARPAARPQGGRSPSAAHAPRDPSAVESPCFSKPTRSLLRRGRGTVARTTRRTLPLARSAALSLFRGSEAGFIRRRAAPVRGWP